MRTPVIVSAVRTPSGKFLGALKSLQAPQLGAIAVREAVARAGVDRSTTPTQTAAMPPTANPGVQPQRLFDTSYGDYATGSYVLAVQGFESYLAYFPKSSRAHEAQLYIGESLAGQKKDRSAGLKRRRTSTKRESGWT